MKIIPMFLKEMDQESITTRKMLASVPTDKFDWRPHPKSMTVRELATHIAELPLWITMVLNTTELDFAANPYTQEKLDSNTELLEYFERSLATGKASLENASEDDLLPEWTLRNGDAIYDVSPKSEVVRMTFCQIVHHRAQLGVFLRLLNIPIPGSYGPSADEMHMYEGSVAAEA
ncbi:DinB family protein [Mucilaginibacter hurinus]|uniref:DinB family protein n=1 Tax=Mucilaginibacter hurinus TaxID=2201324 RepID=A0A367GSS4_9SPHI|nr:DinB family protein [Mucilaginibacter hurinus]RCH55753.1 DinB family protein [Mucilaginibacter hurinus]